MPAAQTAPLPSTILCVDDEATPLTVRKCVLQRAGFHVLTAGSAMDALEILKTTSVHLVVSDHLMPQMTGVQLAAEVEAAASDDAFYASVRRERSAGRS